MPRYDSLLVRVGARLPLACMFSLLAAFISRPPMPSMLALQRSLPSNVCMGSFCCSRRAGRGRLGLDSTTMQHAAALQQQGQAPTPRQPARSSGLLLLPASPLTVLSCQRRRRLNNGLITPAAAAAAWPLQPRCAPSSRRPAAAVACRASSSQPSSSSDSSPSSSSSNADPAAAAAAPSNSQQEPPATAATPSSLTVEAVQTDPAATIDAIQRLTSPSQGDATPVAAASESAVAAGSATADQQQQTEQQQQGAFESFLAAVAAAWAGVQVHWQTLVGFCAAALAAVKASLAKFPAWVAAQKLQKLQEAADGAPTDAGKQAAYLAALNSNVHPR